jgi:putative peptidoglycan lipid II flippase
VDADGRQLLTSALQGFALGLPFFSAYQLLTRTSYATLDSKRPALINIGVAVVNLAAAWILAFQVHLGVRGMALGHAASYVIGAVALFIVLRRRLGAGIDERVASTVTRAGAAAVLCGLAAWGVAGAIASPSEDIGLAVRLFQVSAGILAGVLVFAAAAFMFGIREVDDLRKALTARLR